MYRYGRLTRYRASSIHARSVSTAPVLTLVNKTLSFGKSLETDEPVEWITDSLNRTYEQLDQPLAENAKVNISVLGADEWSQATALVSSLLHTEFMPSNQVALIKQRWKGRMDREILRLTGGPLHVSDDAVHIPSPWFQRFPLPVELCEISARSQQYPFTDLTVLAYNPLSPTSSIENLEPLPNTILAILGQPPSDELITELKKSLPTGFTIAFVEPSRAEKALDALDLEPSSKNISVYTSEALSSGIPALNEAIASKISGWTNVRHAQLETALGRIRISLEGYKQILDNSEQDLVEVERSRKILAEMGQDISIDTILSVDEVDTALNNAKILVARDLDQPLGAWAVILKVDSVGAIIQRTVESHWCGELERSLILKTGLLQVSQTELASLSRALLSSPASESPVTKNKLDQIEFNPQHKLDTRALTSPIYTRRNMLLGHPTTSLHLSAQKYALTLASSIFGGGAVSWLATYGTDFGLSFGAYYGIETGIGAGALASLLGIRWGMGRWQKAKRRWWQDWKRVGEGMDRDLRDNITQVIEQKITAIPKAAEKELSNISDHQKEIFQSKSQQLADLFEELERAETSVRASKPLDLK